MLSCLQRGSVRTGALRTVAITVTTAPRILVSHKTETLTVRGTQPRLPPQLAELQLPGAADSYTRGSSPTPAVGPQGTGDKAGSGLVPHLHPVTAGNVLALCGPQFLQLKKRRWPGGPTTVLAEPSHRHGFQPCPRRMKGWAHGPPGQGFRSGAGSVGPTHQLVELHLSSPHFQPCVPRLWTHPEPGQAQGPLLGQHHTATLREPTVSAHFTKVAVTLSASSEAGSHPPLGQTQMHRDLPWVGGPASLGPR